MASSWASARVLRGLLREPGTMSSSPSGLTFPPLTIAPATITGTRLLRVSIPATYWSVTRQKAEEEKRLFASEKDRARGRARFTGACLAEGVAPSGEGDNDGRRVNCSAPTSFAKAKRPERRRAEGGREGERKGKDRNKSHGACSYTPVSRLMASAEGYLNGCLPGTSRRQRGTLY